MSKKKHNLNLNIALFYFLYFSLILFDFHVFLIYRLKIVTYIQHIYNMIKEFLTIYQNNHKILETI